MEDPDVLSVLREANSPLSINEIMELVGTRLGSPPSKGRRKTLRASITQCLQHLQKQGQAFLFAVPKGRDKGPFWALVERKLEICADIEPKAAVGETIPMNTAGQILSPCCPLSEFQLRLEENPNTLATIDT
jgi:hypothetical protein